jgi:hypothetical protein
MSNLLDLSPTVTVTGNNPSIETSDMEFLMNSIVIISKCYINNSIALDQ